MKITTLKDQVTITKSDIKFADNPVLMLHLNRKYPEYNFYASSGPVCQAVDDSDKVLDMTTAKVRTQLSLNDATCKGNEELDSEVLLTNLVEPVVEEITNHAKGKDIYLYMLLSTGPVINETTGDEEMTYLIRAHY